MVLAEVVVILNGVKELVKLVVSLRNEVTYFSKELVKVESTLNVVQRIIIKKLQACQVVDEDVEFVIMELNKKFKEGKEVFEKCSNVYSWDIASQALYNGDLEKFNDSFLKLLQLIGQSLNLADLLEKKAPNGLASAQLIAEAAGDPSSSSSNTQTTVALELQPSFSSFSGTHGESEMNPDVFIEDASVPEFSTTKGGMFRSPKDGIGMTSLGVDLKCIRQWRSEPLDGNRIFGKATLYHSGDHPVVIKASKQEKKLNLSEHVHRKKKFEDLTKIIRQFRHPNVVPLKAYYYSQEQMLFVYNFYSERSVFSMLEEHQKVPLDTLTEDLKVPLDWDARVKIAIGVAKGIECIHAQIHGKLFHGNIKSSNIFLNTERYGCISELGQSSLFTPVTSIDRYRHPHVAPDVKDFVNSTQASDIYSYGALLLELLYGSLDSDIVKKKLDWDYPRNYFLAKENEGQWFLLSVIACMCTAPGTRPKITDLVSMIERIPSIKNCFFGNQFQAGRQFLAVAANSSSTKIGTRWEGHHSSSSSSNTDQFSFKVDESVDEFRAPVGIGMTRTYDLKVLLEFESKIHLGNGDTVTLCSSGEDQEVVIRVVIVASRKHPEILRLKRLVQPRAIMPSNVQVQPSAIMPSNNKQVYRRAINPSNIQVQPRAIMPANIQELTDIIFQIRHPNVVPVRAYYYSIQKKLLVYDYYSKGSVFSMLEEHLKVPLNWDARLRIAVGVAKGIQCIHAQNNRRLVHGNIKSSNIFLNGENYGCISGLGHYEFFSQVISVETSNGSIRNIDWSFLNKKLHVAPEETSRVRNSTQPADIYSYGVLLAELLYGSLKHDTVKSLISDRCCLLPTTNYSLPKQNVVQWGCMKMVADLCTATSPTKRPKIDDVVAMVEAIHTELQTHQEINNLIDA